MRGRFEVDDRTILHFDSFAALGVSPLLAELEGKKEESLAWAFGGQAKKRGFFSIGVCKKRILHIGLKIG